MNVCVGDIIKLENNQFVAVRDQVPLEACRGFPGRKDEPLLVHCCLFKHVGRERS